MKKYSKRKYGNRKVLYDRIAFDSIKEKDRYVELKLLEQAGEISDLQRQVKFTLIPTQRELGTVGKNGKVKEGKVIERECTYIADFVYKENGKTIVEDVKGVKTKEYILKRKMLLFLKGIRIREV